ncbi:MAG TPA: response regulator, partial [Thermoanaerobaculia bacterium]|nr:response regulator [Thermoanaerobaculia bacterium]
LVELHGGSVEAHSAGTGQGSELIVRLPLPPQPAQEAGVRTLDGGEVQATPPSGLRILVVDDNLDAVESLATLLGLKGHEVATAHDGPAALETAASFRPEVMLLDIGLPGMNGYEVATKLRERDEARQVVLIAVTGWGQDEDRRRSQEAGFHHHLVKPVALAELDRLLASVRSLAYPSTAESPGTAAN